MEDKRNFKRFDRKVPAKLQVFGMETESDSKTHYLMTKDICAGGAFLLTNQAVAPGSEVLAEIALPMDNNLNYESDNHCFVKVRGYVLRTDTAGIAISFQKSFQIEFRELPPYLLNTMSRNN